MALQKVISVNKELPQTGDSTETFKNVGITAILAAILAFFIGRRQKKSVK